MAARTGPGRHTNRPLVVSRALARSLRLPISFHRTMLQAAASRNPRLRVEWLAQVEVAAQPHFGFASVSRRVLCGRRRPSIGEHLLEGHGRGVVGGRDDDQAWLTHVHLVDQVHVHHYARAPWESSAAVVSSPDRVARSQGLSPPQSSGPDRRRTGRTAPAARTEPAELREAEKHCRRSHPASSRCSACKPSARETQPTDVQGLTSALGSNWTDTPHHYLDPAMISCRSCRFLCLLLE